MSKLRIYERRVPDDYVKNKALFETWKSCHFDAYNKPLILKPTNPKSIFDIYLLPWCFTLTRYMYILMVCVCYISRWWVLHIRTSVTYPDDECCISGRLLYIWTMSVTYLDDVGYISGRLFHIGMMEVTYLDGYISARHTSSGHQKHDIDLAKPGQLGPSIWRILTKFITPPDKKLPDFNHPWFSSFHSFTPAQQHTFSIQINYKPNPFI